MTSVVEPNQEGHNIARQENAFDESLDSRLVINLSLG